MEPSCLGMLLLCDVSCVHRHSTRSVHVLLCGKGGRDGQNTEHFLGCTGNINPVSHSPIPLAAVLLRYNALSAEIRKNEYVMEGLKQYKDDPEGEKQFMLMVIIYLSKEMTVWYTLLMPGFVDIVGLFTLVEDRRPTFKSYFINKTSSLSCSPPKHDRVRIQT